MADYLQGETYDTDLGASLAPGAEGCSDAEEGIEEGIEGKRKMKDTKAAAAKSRKKQKKDFGDGNIQNTLTHIHTYIYIHTHTYTHTYIETKLVSKFVYEEGPLKATLLNKHEVKVHTLHEHLHEQLKKGLISREMVNDITTNPQQGFLRSFLHRPFVLMRDLVPLKLLDDEKAEADGLDAIGIVLLLLFFFFCVIIFFICF